MLLAADSAGGGLDEILKMHHLKTAAYSFEAPLRGGALLAGASARHAEGLATLGRYVGIGYQITDDVLGTFGDPQITGKPNDSYLREGKRTVLIALAERDPELATLFRRWRAGKLTSHAVRAELRAHGVETQAQSLVEQYRTEAHRVLDDLPILEDSRDRLSLVIDNILNRNG